MTTYSQIASNKIRTYLILTFFVVLIFTFFYLLGQYFGNPKSYFLIGLVVSLAMSLGSYFYSDKLVLAMAGAKPADKKDFFDYYTAAENMSIAAGLPMPALFVINDTAMNAFATGRNPKHAVVAATTGLLVRLDRAEVEGVIAHEISHIKNYDMLVSTIVAVLVGTLVFVADWVSRSLWWGSSSDRDRSDNRLGGILFIIFLFITPVLATLIQLAITRRREYLADATGALLNRNPDALANALIKISGDSKPLTRASNATAHLYIENPFKTDSGKKTNFIINLFSTHPPVEERIRLLREM